MLFTAEMHCYSSVTVYFIIWSFLVNDTAIMVTAWTVETCSQLPSIFCVRRLFSTNFLSKIITGYVTSKSDVKMMTVPLKSGTQIYLLKVNRFSWDIKQKYVSWLMSSCKIFGFITTTNELPDLKFETLSVDTDHRSLLLHRAYCYIHFI
jgi:hypothetical protein